MEVLLLSSHLVLLRVRHLQEVYRIFRYLKQVPKKKVYFDPTKPSISEDILTSFVWEDFYKDAQDPIPTDMLNPRGKSMLTHSFVDANQAGENTTRQLMTRILIF